MHLETQYRVKNNPNDLRFLRENSSWYKYLNRNKVNIKRFEEEMKKTYKLTTKDRVEKFVNGLDTMSKIMDILN